MLKTLFQWLKRISTIIVYIQQGLAALYNSRAALIRKKKPLRTKFIFKSSRNQYKIIILDKKYDKLSKVRALIKSIY